MVLTPPPGFRKAGSTLLGGTTPDDPTRPGALMEEAVTDLTRCGSAPDLYAGARHRGDELRLKYAEFEGPHNRTRFARNCILFSAFASEAYVNAFLAGGSLSGSDLDALDRLPTVEKYVIGVAYREGEAVFDRGAEPIQTLRRLFRTRDALVHPKPSGAQAPVVNPAVAAEFLVAAATASQRLIERAGAGDAICKQISEYPDIYIDWGKRWTNALPPLEAEAPRNLTAVAAERMFSR